MVHSERVSVININFGDLKNSLALANSAMKASAIAEEMEKNQRIADVIARQSAQRDATLIAGAEANIEQRDLMQQQLDILHEQNALLADNYDKLKDLYDDQVQANIEAKAELAKTKRYNAAMMVVSIISMLAAVASTVIPFLCEQLK